jgi:hypothetical protein
LGAGGGFAGGEAALAQVAFADDAALGVVFGDVVGAFQHAVAATDALVVEVDDDAGDGIFFVGEDGAAVEAGGVGAVVAGGGDGLRKRIGGVGADEEADVTPRLLVVEAVEGVAGGDAGFAAGAGVELDFESVVLAGAGSRERDELAGKLRVERWRRTRERWRTGRQGFAAGPARRGVRRSGRAWGFCAGRP